ncbi:putative xylulose kinase protein [Pseudooceanicola batsensis HTCC2597]|uniref:Xylulose kinase n=1 Tax=Pseudooceanicola batsensis (strain ATCC BAA-863 / DSM 15984 / KCTC 12145 / HTCC2597) TaxID=252305 RepID=A3TWQ8_PSEBH|nr:xylulokinase [Pseudooceanicola batsensis]EAQ04054.1 putative xylulose kinase protein [Pseudooceanicola batsensis HTCC2597]
MYLGLDLGTSGLRAILVDDEGNVQGEAEAAFDLAHPHPGWSEQDPAAWIAACETAVGSLRDRCPKAFGALRGIGLSGHMHGATLLDADDAVLRPCILWNDTRSTTEAAALDATPGIREITGNIVFPGFTAPKLAWVRNNEPAVFDRVAKVLLPKDYLRLWLTGEHISDMSDSAGTAWLDVGARAWSDKALEAGGMRRAQMPDLVEGSAPGGELRPALREAWGLDHPVVVAGGAGDNAAAACGSGCLGEGTGFVSLGTSGVLMAGRDSYCPDPASAVHSFCHAVPGRWYQMGVILAATDSLNWLARNLRESPADLANSLPASAQAPSPLMFLPYLSGERTPHNDTRIRGAFVGLDVAMDRTDLTRAVMEGVAFALRDSLEALRGTGARFDTLLATGGGARSRFWLTTLANVLDLPLSLPRGSELGAAMGAASLARAAATGADPDSIMRPPEAAEVIEPHPEARGAYEAAYQRYRALYPALANAG